MISFHAGGERQSSPVVWAAVFTVVAWCSFARGCSWEKRGCARAGGDVEEREKYVMVVNGYCG